MVGVCGADLNFIDLGPEMRIEQGMRLGHEFVGNSTQSLKALKPYNGNRMFDVKTSAQLILDRPAIVEIAGNFHL